MRKGQFGITYVCYAVIAMILAWFGQTLALVLLTAFMIAVEKDEWASKQCLQACGLVGTQWLISECISILNKPVSWIGRFIKDYESSFYSFQKVYDHIFYFVREVVDIAVIVLVIMAILNILKEKDANIPVISKFADWAYGIGGGKKCPKCGSVVKGNFCDKCGTKLD